MPTELTGRDTLVKNPLQQLSPLAQTLLGRFFKKKPTQAPGLLCIYITEEALFLAYRRMTTPNTTPIAVTLTHTISLKEQSLTEGLTAWIQLQQLQGVATLLVLNPADYRLIYLDAPDHIAEEELGSAAKWLVKDFINFPLEDAVVDAFAVPVRAGQPAKMYGVVTQLSRLQTLLTACEAAQLRVLSIDIAELALRNILHLIEDGEQEVGLIFMGPHFNALLISRKNTLCFCRNIETKVSSDAASPDNSTSSTEKLVTELERSINYYQSHMGAPELKKIVALLDLNQAEQVLKSLSDALGRPCPALDINTLFQMQPPLSPEEGIKMAIALGGLLQEVNDGTTH